VVGKPLVANCKSAVGNRDILSARQSFELVAYPGGAFFILFDVCLVNPIKLTRINFVDLTS
jgi:hypothetical protein